MPLRFFHKFDDANGNSIINAFEDWFAEHGFDIGPQTFLSFLKNAEPGGHALTGTEGPLESAATAVPANSPLQYFIKVNGVTGDATLKGFEGWFAVDAFDWGVQNTTSIGSATGGAGAGKASFSPLTVDIHSLSGLASLFGDAARGENLGTVELAAVDSVKGQTLKVYDIKLSDVVLGGFENDPGPNGVETALAFDFAKVAVTVQPQTNKGNLGPPQTVDFGLTATTDAVASDIAASAVSTTTVPLESAATPVPANSPLQYFIKVDGATGDATLKGFEGWFAVDGFDWGVQNSETIGSATGGAGAGKATFSPLTVDIHSLSGLASLFGDAARGENLGTVELAAVDTIKGQSLKVYDIKLSDVVLGGFENDPGPNGVETALAFDFAKVAVTVQPQTNKGNLGPPQTVDFGLTATTDAVASDIAASAVSTTTVPLESAATPVPANSPLQYFIKVDGATGDATLKGFEGWFSVDGFDWGVQNATSIGSATGGAGAGKASFSPLTVDIHSLSGLASLFSDAARGENLGTVELAAVDTVKGQTLKVYDIKLSDVVLGGFENDPGPNGVETALAFDFGKVAVTVQPQTNKGNLGPPQTGEFGLTATTDAVASDIAASPVSTATVPLESAATPVPANSPLQYFIKVDGATGDATLKGFEGWFAVDGFDWGVQNATSIGSATGGAGAGKATFSPLTIDIHSLTGLASLFGDAARGENLGTVELAAVDTVKGQSLKVYDIKLSDVFVGGFENDPGPNGVETALAFDFGKINVTVQPQTTKGGLGVPQTGEFDVTGAATTDAVANDISASAVSTTQVSLASAATPVPANSPLQYFIKVEGATGDATLKGFEGWFSVDGFDWGVQNSETIGSATGGAGAGKASFSPLTVDIHSLSGLASLFSDAARGENLGTVELAAVDTVKGQSLKVYDIKLSDVFVGGFENDPGPNGVETALAFDFGKINVTVQPQTTKGSLGVPQTGEFDVAGAATTDAVANDVIASAATTTTTTQVSLASAATPVPANSPLQYFLKVDGATGDATLKGFEGWFSVDGFDWGAQNATSIGSATGGAGAGKASFSPLTVDIHSLAGLATLFSDAARGENLGTVELAAVDTIKGQTLKVYDVKLSDVVVSGFENDPGPNGVETALAFDFGKVNVTVQPPTTNGKPGVPQTADAGLSPSDLLFNPTQGALLSPASIASLLPQDLTWNPTLTSAHS